MIVIDFIYLLQASQTEALQALNESPDAQVSIILARKTVVQPRGKSNRQLKVSLRHKGLIH